MQAAIGRPSSKNSTDPDGSIGPGRLAGGATVAVKVVLAPGLAVLVTSREVEVESRPTVRLAAPVDPVTVAAASGANTAVRRSADVDAPNDVWQMAIGVDGAMVSATHPEIGEPPFSNVIVPDLEPVVEVIVASNVTPWFVTGAEGRTSSHVLLRL
jgi:hypothetical protein